MAKYSAPVYGRLLTLNRVLYMVATTTGPVLEMGGVLTQATGESTKIWISRRVIILSPLSDEDDSAGTVESHVREVGEWPWARRTRRGCSSRIPRCLPWWSHADGDSVVALEEDREGQVGQDTASEHLRLHAVQSVLKFTLSLEEANTYLLSF